MSAKSKKSAAAKNKRRSDLRRPFAPNLLERARRIAGRYQVVVWAEDGEFYGRGIELPNVFNDGKTEAQCVVNTRDALTTAVAVLLEDGAVPPSPASGGNRTEQVNVRVGADEKLILEAAAQRKGFRGIGDFMRAAALATAQ